MKPFSFGPESDQLFQAILSLRNKQECEAFFRDLCTLGELQAMTERWQIVCQLQQKLSYRKIAEQVGASTATVTRVSHWLQHGQGGYKKAYNRCHPEE